MVATLLRSLLAAAAAGLLVAACNPCKPGTQRCNGTVVEICRPDKKWSVVQDCSKLKRTKSTFTCACKTDKGKKCYCKVQKGAK